MTWLALRLLRPYLIAAAALAAAATAVTLHGAGVVQRRLDAAGLPGCTDANLCYPEGPALDAVLRMELAAAFVPSLLGLIVGVALFAREREEDTLTFALTQSISRRRWVLTKFGWALAAALACAAPVAGVHRLVATRYTVLANDTYEMLQLLHLNNAGFMLAQTALLVALGGTIGLSTGRTLPTLVLTVLGAPFALLSVIAVAAVLTYLAVPLFGLGPGAGDLYLLDPLAYLTGVVAAAGVTALVLAAPRLGARG